MTNTFFGGSLRLYLSKIRIQNWKMWYCLLLLFLCGSYPQNLNYLRNENKQKTREIWPKYGPHLNLIKMVQFVWAAENCTADRRQLNEFVHEPKFNMYITVIYQTVSLQCYKSGINTIILGSYVCLCNMFSLCLFSFLLPGTHNAYNDISAFS